MHRAPSAEFPSRPAADPSRRQELPWLLAGLSLAILSASLGAGIAPVALPTLAELFALPFRHVQWIALAYLLTVTCFIVAAGRLGDMVGRRRLLLAGLLLFTVASAGCGLAPSFWFLVAARAAQGLGAAAMMALAMALVGDVVPRDRIGRAMGLLGTMSAIGTALGPAVGGLAIATFGWRAVFLLNLPLGILALVLLRHALPADRPERGTAAAGFDGAGMLLLAGTLAAYALAMTSGGPRGTGPALLLAAAIGAVLFVLVESRLAAPLVRVAMFRDVAFSTALLASLLVSTVMMATLVVGPFYLARAVGLSAALAGLVLSVGPVVSAASGVIVGPLVDRLGTARATVAGLATMAAGAIGLAALPLWLGLPGYVAAILVLTPGYQLFQAANNSAIMKDAPATARGTFSGMLQLARNLGLVTGASVMGALFALASGAADIADAPASAVTSGMAITFAVAALLILAGIGLVVLGNRMTDTGSSR